MKPEPITHLEKSIAGTVAPVTHLEKVIEQYGGGGGGGSVTVDAELSASSENPVQNKVINAALAEKGTYSKPSGGIPKSDLSSAVRTSIGKADTALQAAPVTSVNGKTGAVVLNAEDIGGAQESLKLTATPTAGPSGDALMSGTWSGATLEEVVEAIQASRLIQIDVATVGKITLLYNLGSATNASSNAFVYNVGGTLYSVFVELNISNGNNRFYLWIINSRTATVNISGTTPTIEPKANKIYQCGELTSLKIINPPATGKYSIIFFSGATATTTVGIENFVAEANKRYKITVEDNYATYDSWSYTP